MAGILASAIDAAVAAVSPQRAVRRQQSRQVLAYYEAARRSQYRKGLREGRSADAAVAPAGRSLREQARHAEQNHDLARGALNILTANTVGATGIQFEPQPLTLTGEVHTQFARAIDNLLETWAESPEVTGGHDWASVQRLMARTWIRDGDVFAQRLSGSVRGLTHGTSVPYSLEMLEPDHVPMDLDSDSPRIIQGVEKNGWGRPVAYHVYDNHPGGDQVGFSRDTRRINAGRMFHLRLIDRIEQTRGVSVFASVLARLEDVKDYEESERIAAKVAASMAAYIKKGSPDLYANELDEQGELEPRGMKFSPGMIFDDLEPGEEIGTIDTSRPNSGLEGHRKGQLRAASRGLSVNYSSLAGDYDGSYSSQRQELVEGWGNYAIISAELISQFVRPVISDVITTAIAAGVLQLPADADPQRVTRGIYLPPQMPWIDPAKEAKAFETLENNTHASGPEIIRRRGRNPRDVLEQERLWQKQKREAGLVDGDDSDNSDNSGNPAARFGSVGQ